MRIEPARIDRRHPDVEDRLGRERRLGDYRHDQHGCQCHGATNQAGHGNAISRGRQRRHATALGSKCLQCVHNPLLCEGSLDCRGPSSMFGETSMGSRRRAFSSRRPKAAAYTHMCPPLSRREDCRRPVLQVCVARIRHLPVVACPTPPWHDPRRSRRSSPHRLGSTVAMAQILFKNAKLLDPPKDALQGGVSVLVEGETIREVSSKPIKAPKADVIDCKGRTLMPGLIDCHVHVMLSEVNIRYLEADPADHDDGPRRGPDARDDRSRLHDGARHRRRRLGHARQRGPGPSPRSAHVHRRPRAGADRRPLRRAPAHRRPLGRAASAATR